MRYLITGGCGFIGSNFIRYILKKYKDIKVCNLDKLTYCGNMENLRDIEKDKRYSFIKGDICNEKLVMEAMKGKEVIVNFAAETHVDRSIKYPNDFLKTNVFGVKVMLEAARKSGVKKFIQISTDEVYGSVPKGFSKEDSRLNPRSPYSATKAAADLLALSYHTTYKLPVVVVRSSNNFGRYQYPEKVIPLFITNLIMEKKVPLYGDGKNIREWLYVEDNCSAIDVVISKGVPGEIYNVGSGDLVDNNGLALKILAIFGKDNKCIKYVNDRPGHDRRYALDSSKIRRLGWDTKNSFEADLGYTVGWYVKNGGWWEPLRERSEIIEW